MRPRPAGTILAALTGAWIGVNIDGVPRMKADISDANLALGAMLGLAAAISQYRPLDPLSTEALLRIANRKSLGSNRPPGQS